MFGVVPKQIWQHLNPADERNLCTWAMRCLLLLTPNGRRILIDTGIGNKQSDKFFGHYHLHGSDSLLGSLAKQGLQAADITDVVLTHLHFDHVGGAVSRTDDGRLVPTFPHALYWTNEAHWQHANQPNARERASFLPENFVPLHEAGVLRFATDQQFIYPNLQLRFVYGHTHAMMLPHIDHPKGKLVYMADLVPSAAHLRLSYVMGYDMQPLVSLNEKADFLGRAIEEQHSLFFEHDPVHACAQLQRTAKGDVEAARLFDLSAW